MHVRVQRTRSKRRGRRFDKSKVDFDRHLAFEQSNITVPGEQELVDELTTEFANYLKLAAAYFDRRCSPAASDPSTTSRAAARFREAQEPGRRRARLEPAEHGADEREGAATSSSSPPVDDGCASGRGASGGRVGGSSGKVDSGADRCGDARAQACAEGNADQVVPATTRDELGELGQAFNTMARTIREYREAGTARLLRAQKTAQATIDSFPDPVMVVDLPGRVERANPAGQRLLHAIPPVPVQRWRGSPDALKPHLDSVLKGNGDYLPLGLDQAIFLRDGSQDRYFLPRVLRIRSDTDEILGAAIVLSDVTKLQLVDQLKSDMIATVSHELKTPLTSLQMVIYLLLEEAVGPLTPKQLEILIAARQDSERLLAMINDLLDLTRIEQGRLTLDLRPVEAARLVNEAQERFRSLAEDGGIVLATQVDAPSAMVMVDKERFEHVFDNLLANALRHTHRDGKVTVGAAIKDKSVCFWVQDTGEGIPEDYLPRIFR